MYVSPSVAREGVGEALVRLAETRMAQEGHPRVVLESSLNAVEFYLRLGFAVTGARCASGAIPMRKQVVGASGGT